MWDSDLNKYIEESNILAVQLTRQWWNDPKGQTMPTIAAAYRNANASSGGPSGPRRDGFVPILDYHHHEQAWENADVNDYQRSGGTMKDRRWEEGSTTFERNGIYYLTYSANNWQTPDYGVGYAVAKSPLGPFTKYVGNPILSQNATIGMYSTGHGSVAFSPDGTEAHYVHHGRPTATEPQRRLYTDRMYFKRAGLDSFGYPILSIDAATSDRPIPAGVAPYSIRASSRRLRVRSGAATRVSWQVHSAAGAALALSNPLNAVRVSSADPGVTTVSATAAGATVFGERRGRTTITVIYQRELSAGEYLDVFNRGGHHRQLVSVTMPVKVQSRRR